MASGPEIRQYIKDVSMKFDLTPNISFNSTLVSSTWNESTGKWDLEGKPLS
jgi:cation diffusion facilitator CzcD-associated flavoprotein CzcO